MLDTLKYALGCGLLALSLMGLIGIPPEPQWAIASTAAFSFAAGRLSV